MTFFFTLRVFHYEGQRSCLFRLWSPSIEGGQEAGTVTVSWKELEYRDWLKRFDPFELVFHDLKWREHWEVAWIRSPSLPAGSNVCMPNLCWGSRPCTSAITRTTGRMQLPWQASSEAWRTGCAWGSRRGGARGHRYWHSKSKWSRARAVGSDLGSSLCSAIVLLCDTGASCGACLVHSEWLIVIITVIVIIAIINNKRQLPLLLLLILNYFPRKTYKTKILKST